MFPKTKFISSVLLGFSVVFSAFPSYSSGSMAPSPQIIIVRPAPAIRHQSEIRQREKAKSAAKKTQASQAKAAEKARQKSRDAANKAYEKKLAAQRKKTK